MALNINAVDAMGRTAIEIAVDNENVEIVELLLQQVGFTYGCIINGEQIYCEWEMWGKDAIIFNNITRDECS